ncbi:hypothetical protein ACQEWB_27805 [Streptomyces sp. CA-249302]|uniref:hypothetical protein n=1 Tax=Streptomyces sp. CA-249302 TaxID=3240058 RepID=UPI003D8E88F9
MKKRWQKVMWAGVAVAVVAVAVMVALVLHGLRTMGADDGSPLERVLAHIDRLAGRKPCTTVFTGLSVDEDRQTADVWRIPSAAFDDEVCGSALKGVTVRLHDTDVDQAEPGAA